MSDERPTLRSTVRFGGAGTNAFMHRSGTNEGHPGDVVDGRPVLGIGNTWSGLTPCNAHLRGLADHGKNGVDGAGGLPRQIPVMSLGGSNMRPTAMPFRAGGGPRACGEDGDPIGRDGSERRLHLDVDATELVRWRNAWSRAEPNQTGGHKLLADYVVQADAGCDVDIVLGHGRAGIPRHFD